MAACIHGGSSSSGTSSAPNLRSCSSRRSCGAIPWPRRSTGTARATTPPRPPVLLGFVVSPRGRGKVPVREQWLAAGAALGNLLNAAHQLGFGAIVLSGDRCFDPVLGGQLGIRASEYLAGFISIGSVAEVPPARRHVLPGEVWSCWLPSVRDTEDATDTPDGDVAARGPELDR